MAFEGIFKSAEEKIKEIGFEALDWAIDSVVDVAEFVDKKLKADPEIERLIVVAHTALKAVRDYIAKAEIVVETEVKKEEVKDAPPVVVDAPAPVEQTATSVVAPDAGTPVV
jgi:hypothetical protein